MKLIIQIKRCEGPIACADKVITAETFAEVNKGLSSWSMTAPKDGGYDKCDYTVKDADSDLDYEGRLDLTHFSHGAPDLKATLMGSIAFFAGLKRPSHMKEEAYEHYLNKTVSEGDRQTLKRWLEIVKDAE